MDKGYCIWVVSPDGYKHSRAFDEIAAGLRCAFREIGCEAPVVRDVLEITGRPVILGCNLIPRLCGVRIPERAVMYNLEQIQSSSSWMTEDYIDLLRSFEVWDYSGRNMARLRKLGVRNIKFCGIGYVPELTRIPESEKDIDVLLYGSVNERRYKILKELDELGFEVKVLFGCYGEARDRYIARSKIILNVHYYEAKVFEMVRVSYLLANRKFVVSETGDDPELEMPFRGGVVFARYENLVDECARYLAEDAARDEIAKCGFSRIRTFPQSRFLKEALGCKGHVN
jgi:hypothetical protein